MFSNVRNDHSSGSTWTATKPGSSGTLGQSRAIDREIDRLSRNRTARKRSVRCDEIERPATSFGGGCASRRGATSEHAVRVICV